MEWVYDNRQKEKEILNAYLERYTLLEGIGICSQTIIRKEGNIEIYNYDLTVYIKQVTRCSSAVRNLIAN